MRGNGKKKCQFYLTMPEDGMRMLTHVATVEDRRKSNLIYHLITREYARVTGRKVKPVSHEPIYKSQKRRLVEE